MTKKAKSDPVTWMHSHFQHTPPSAIAAFTGANKNRGTKAVWSSKAMMPAAVAAALTKPRIADVSDSAKPITIGKHIAATLKALDGETAADVVASMRAGMARMFGSHDRDAESHLKSRGLKPFAIGTTGSPTGGGYLTPDPVSAALYTWLGRYGAARAIATIIPATSGQASVPFRASSPTVYNVDEATAITASDFSVGSLGIHIQKRGVLTKISNELQADSAASILDMWIQIVGNALLSVEDNELVNGDGTSTYYGIVGLLAKLGAGGTVSAATGHDTWPELDVDDFAATMAKVPEQFCTGQEAWLCSAPFYAAGMLASVGGNAQGVDSNGRPLFLGKPVVLSEKMPRTATAATVCCLYGDFASAVTFADRGLSFGVSDLAPGVFAENCTALRATSRYDIVVTNGGDGSNPGAYVGLKTAA